MRDFWRHGGSLWREADCLAACGGRTTLALTVAAEPGPGRADDGPGAPGKHSGMVKTTVEGNADRRAARYRLFYRRLFETTGSDASSARSVSRFGRPSTSESPLSNAVPCWTRVHSRQPLELDRR